MHRERAGVTQEALGAAVGVTKTTVYRWEQGDAWAEYANLEAIAQELNVPVIAFFDGVRTEIKPTVDEALEVIKQALAGRVHHETGRQDRSTPPPGRNNDEPGGEFQEIIKRMKERPELIDAVRAVLQLPFGDEAAELGDHPKNDRPKPAKPK